MKLKLNLMFRLENVKNSFIIYCLFPVEGALEPITYWYKQLITLTFIPMANLKCLINLLSYLVFSGAVGGSQSSRRNSTNSRGEQKRAHQLGITTSLLAVEASVLPKNDNRGA